MLINGGKFGNKRLLSENSVKFLTSGKLLPYQQLDLEKWQGLEGFTYGNLMRVLDDPSQATIIGNKGEYGWDGWLGTFFENLPTHGITMLMGMQLSDPEGNFISEKIRNLIHPML